MMVSVSDPTSDTSVSSAAVSNSDSSEKMVGSVAGLNIGVGSSFGSGSSSSSGT